LQFCGSAVLQFLNKITGITSLKIICKKKKNESV
jgi:hypothetical protein